MLRTRQWTGDCRDRKQLVGKLAFLLPGKAPWREKEKKKKPNAIVTIPAHMD